MTTSFNLSLPTDIPWEKICGTLDMMDRVVCDTELPPKWQSSIAVFRYVPADEYQLYPAYKITYLKVAITITGFQPLDEEIQGHIDWDGVNTETIDGLADLLNSYYPCTGAILQVVVGPDGEEPTLPLEEYPFFMDFEPKKRELYELATDTKEKQSRSIETLNLSKSAGTTKSLETMDIDMGGGGFGMQGSYAGTGGGFSYTAPSGQWGTKSMNTDASQTTRASESGNEKRETLSHTTQLSQMYHQLDSYHLGMNRAVFFVQPRPHVIEEPSGFVRGPRKVEGIQEFFLVVAQPRDQEEEFCVALRLDTGHLIETDILDYEHRTDVSEVASAKASFPTDKDMPDGSTTRTACAPWPFDGDCWDVHYTCYRTHDVVDEIYTAPAGFIVESTSDLVHEDSHGSSSVTIAPGRKTLTVHAEASGHICFENGWECVNCPDEVDKWSGHARRQVQVNLRSEEKTVKVGTQQQFLVTTRGLCCCESGPIEPPPVLVTAVWEIPVYLGGRVLLPTVPPKGFVPPHKVPPPRDGIDLVHTVLPAGMSRGTGQRDILAAPATRQPPSDCGCQSTPSNAPTPSAGHTMTIRQANEMSAFMRDKLVSSFNDPRPGYEPRPFIETDLFLHQLEARVRRSRTGRLKMSDHVPRTVSEEVRKALAKYYNKKAEQLTVSDVLRPRAHEYLRLAKMDPTEAAKIKLQLLGVKLIREGKMPGGKGQKGRAAKE